MRLRRQLAAAPGGRLYVQPAQDIRIGGRQSNAQYQYTALGDRTASRLGLTMYPIDNTLYDAFGQRAVSTIYSAINQFHVVMEVAPGAKMAPVVGA